MNPGSPSAVYQSLADLVGARLCLLCCRVARLPYREYEVFTRLLQEELEEEEAEEADSDSDSDDSDSDLDDESTTGYHSRGGRSR